MRKFMTRGTSRRKMMKKMRSNDALRVSVGDDSFRIPKHIVLYLTQVMIIVPLFLFHGNLFNLSYL